MTLNNVKAPVPLARAVALQYCYCCQMQRYNPQRVQLAKLLLAQITQAVLLLAPVLLVLHRSARSHPPGHFGLEAVVDGDAPPVVQLNADILEAHVLGEGPSADADQQNVTGQSLIFSSGRSLHPERHQPTG